MLFIMSSEADEEKGQAPVCGADASAPSPLRAAVSLYNLLSQESDTARLGPGKQRLGEGFISSVDWCFPLLFFEATLAHYFYFPSPWTSSSCPHLQGPGPWPHLCPVVQKASNSEAFQPRRLSLHIEGHFCHLLSMKCGFQYIIWKQKRKNHRGPSCKNNHYPLK